MADGKTPDRTEPATKPVVPEKPAAPKTELDDGALRDVTGGSSDMTITKQTDVSSPKF